MTQRTRHVMGVTTTWSLVLSVMIGMSGCATNPVTGRRELSLISESQEIQMGREASAGDLKRVGEVPQPEVQAMVRRIGTAMAAKSERPNLPWEFHVLDDAAVNAFAYPGGFIFVTRGLLTNLNSEAELAEVIGHEIGHVTAKHSVVQMSQQQVAQIGLVGASIFSSTVAKYGDVLGGGASLLFLKFGRDDELQSDALGFQYSLAQQYDVREAPKVFQTLGRLSGGGGRVPEWQSTHPDPGNRAQRAEQRAATVPAATLATLKVNRDGYLRLLNGMVFGENPRQGYFEGTRFLHPDLRFQFDFPSGWKFANQPEAVVGVSADNGAQLQLLPATGTPAQALQSFLAQQGITTRQSSNTTVNGLTAAAATFDATTQQGALQGRALSVAHNGQTYLLLGLMVPDAAATRGAEVEATLRSFRALTDANALNKQPAKVELVTLDQAMTGAQFVQRYPSTVSTDEVYIANGIEAGTSLARGTILKRIR
ncbi:MAG TPA: M48 family metalloprotease [Gemmatimonas sp.]|uniref:M48 family metalloprotease n=1 Tax=Gemmatimonas sp. TaxID=1962908 RepID=UPI002ED8D4C1